MHPTNVLDDMQDALVALRPFILSNAYSPLRRLYMERVVSIPETRAEDSRAPSTTLFTATYNHIHEAAKHLSKNISLLPDVAKGTKHSRDVLQRAYAFPNVQMA